MSAAIDYCNKQIAECEQLIIDYPHETECQQRIIAGWQRTKQRLLTREALAAKEQTA
jgi:hypothetical protein